MDEPRVCILERWRMQIFPQEIQRFFSPVIT
jgi:hypothetical protein